MFASVVAVDPAVVVTSPVKAGMLDAANAPVTSAAGTVAVVVTAPVPLPLTYCPEASVVTPVPPFATATTPVTLVEVPVVFWLSVGISPAWIADITTFVPLPRRYCPEVVDAAMALSAPCCVLAPVPPRLTGSVPAEMFDALIGVLTTEVILPFISTVICGTCESVPYVPAELVFAFGSSVKTAAFFVTAGVPWFTTTKSVSESADAVGKLEIFTSAITSRCIACSSAALVLLGAAPCQ